MPRRVLTFALAAVSIACQIGDAQAAPGVVSEYRTPLGAGAATHPRGVTIGNDGTVWYTDWDGQLIGRMSPFGSFTTYPLAADSFPEGIVTDVAGNVWFAEYGSYRIGMLTPEGVLTELPLPAALVAALAHPWAVTALPSSSGVWFTAAQWVGRATVDEFGSPRVTVYRLPPGAFAGAGITGGPDGRIWFTDGNSVLAMAQDGSSLATYPVGDTAGVWGIASGTDGNLWFAESRQNRIGRITPDGSITTFPLPTSNAGPLEVAPGADGNMWFTEVVVGQIGRISPSSPVVTEFPALAPSGPEGIAEGTGGLLWFAASGEGQDQGYIGVVTTGLDAAAPRIDLSSPADGGEYRLGAPVGAAYGCVDEPGGSGVRGCTGTVASGAPVDTSHPGAFSFAVTSTDLAGNTATVTHRFAVAAPPAIAIDSPADGASYVTGDRVAAAYDCTPGAGSSGLSTCAGPVVTGASIDTSQAGSFAFTVRATDHAGNDVSLSHSYVVVARSTALVHPRLSASWHESHLRGVLVVTGRTSVREALQIGLSGRHRRISASFALRLPAGSFRRTLTLPPRLLPDQYAVHADGTALSGPAVHADVEVRTLPSGIVLAGPAEGVVDHGWISSVGSTPVKVLYGPHKHLTAHFHFAARPRARVVRISWYAPSRKGPVAFEDVPAGAVAAGTVSSGQPFPRGVWRAVASVRGVVVSEASVTLR
jgi:virginiamycin B lyase